jgi:hypothetical protein
MLVLQTVMKVEVFQERKKPVAKKPIGPGWSKGAGFGIFIL